MAEQDQVATPTGGLGRRDFVKRSALLGGMVWAAPAMSTLGPRAFGQPQESPFIVDEDCEGGFKVRFQWRNPTATLGEGYFEDCDTAAPACFPNDPPSSVGTTELWDSIPVCVQPQENVKSGQIVVDGTTYQVIAGETQSPSKVLLTLTTPPASEIFFYAASGSDTDEGCTGVKRARPAPNQLTFDISAGDEDTEINLNIVRGVFCFIPNSDG